MKQVILFLSMLGAAVGCMDIQLLDEMNRWDTEEIAEMGTDSEPVFDSESKNAPDTAVNGPPPFDTSDINGPVVETICGANERSVDGLCIYEDRVAARIWFATNEPSEATTKDNVGIVLSPKWEKQHEGLILFNTIEKIVTVQFTATDVNHNSTTIQVDVAAQDGYGVRITEVLADCRAAEPDGEFVEISNLGLDDVDLSGWMIDDNGDANGDIFAEGTLLRAGEVAVLATNGFVGAMGRLVPLESSIGSGGLKNSESETVELYDAHGALVDEYVNLTQAPKEGTSYIRRHAALPAGTPNLWIANPSPSPGRVE